MTDNHTDPHDEPVNVTDEQVQDAADDQNEADVLREELQQMTGIAKRTMADFQNFKRRTEEEREQLMAFANKELLNVIFPAVDNLERALQSMPEELDGSEWAKGLKSTQESFLQGLQAAGLEIIDQTGIPANPNEHDVLMEDDGPKGEILEVFERGYRLKGKTIRPAKVKVGRD